MSDRASDTNPRVVIVQPALPTYRVRLFEEMAEQVPLLLVYSGSSPEGVESVTARLKCEVSVVKETSILGKFFWQRGVLRIVASQKVSKLVVGGNPRYLSSVLALLIARFRRVPVIMWGHAASSTSSGLGSFIRNQLMRFADKILLYYPEEIARLPERLRDRAFGVDNSIDTRRIAAIEHTITEEKIVRHVRRHGLENSPLLITIGRLTSKANVALLISSLSIVKDRGTRAALAVIGEGPERAALEKLAEQLGVSDSIIWVGAVYDEEDISLWMKSAAAFVYGGAVGLSLIHAFAYGLPAIISADMADHNPEALLFRDGITGATFLRGDPNSLADAICERLADPTGLRSQGATAHGIAHERLGIERMASRFLSVLDEGAGSATA